MRYSAAFLTMAGVALATPFEKRDACVQAPMATVTPCPECPQGQYPAPITVTQQHQPCSTYIPLSTMCHDNGCTTAYEISSYNWVSTVIPCYGSSLQCTVTNEWQPVTVSASQTYSVASMACPTAGAYTCPNGQVTTVAQPTTVYYAQPINTYYVAPYCQLGPMAIPGFPGSGLCDRCSHNGLSQEVLVQRCENGRCALVEETWYGNVGQETAIQTTPYSINQMFNRNGVYAFPSIGITLNINNAPTSVSTAGVATNTVTRTTTATRTEGPTVTETENETATAAVDVDGFFVVNIAPSGNSRTKRDVSPYSGYLGFANDEALTVHGRSNAARFQLTNGRLFVNGKFVGASADALNQGVTRFTLYDTEPEFSTTFTAVENGPIVFTNDAFTFNGGVAIPCASVDGEIFHQLTEGADFACRDLEFTIESVPAPANSATPTASNEPTPSASNIASVDPSASVVQPTVVPSGTPAARVKREFKDAKMVRRGGLLRSPLRRHH